MLLIFILLGMAFGSDGVVKIWFDDYHLAEQICSTALILSCFTVDLAPSGTKRNRWPLKRCCSPLWEW